MNYNNDNSNNNYNNNNNNNNDNSHNNSKNSNSIPTLYDVQNNYIQNLRYFNYGV